MDKDERKVETALDRLRNLKEFSCIQCGQWIATLEDGLHDTCQTAWKIYTDCGLCRECWEKQIDPDAAREKFQSVMDKFWAIIKNDLNKKALDDDKKFLSEQEKIEPSETQVNQ